MERGFFLCFCAATFVTSCPTSSTCAHTYERGVEKEAGRRERDRQRESRGLQDPLHNTNTSL